MLAGQLESIRHWQVDQKSYEHVPISRNATWFIDPPYVGAGKRYKYNNKGINYDHLARWCRSIEGQVIVCESTGAEWLPFQPHSDHTNGSNKPYHEMIWTKGVSTRESKKHWRGEFGNDYDRLLAVESVEKGLGRPVRPHRWVSTKEGTLMSVRLTLLLANGRECFVDEDPK